MKRWLLAMLACGCSAGEDLPPPTLATVTPQHAPSDVAITLTGDYFCQQVDTGNDRDPLDCDHPGGVSFDAIPAAVGSYTDEMITAMVPTLAPGTYRVTVTSSGRRSNSIDFKVDPP